ncbi:replicative DNA helicase [Desulfitibacter alkalitolerans]|uniref:replicative DNA helicase n=1 Tax=Desulfitibacter alkalitolerans TaxID=264641 RepID=UPI000687C11D|nr:replicative DNA helicase [Desulfitibacter alkalitolerans]
MLTLGLFRGCTEINLYDLESEKYILGAMLQNDYCLTESMAALGKEDFYDQLHQTVFEMIVKLYQRGIKPTYFELVKEVSPGLIDLDRLSDITKVYIKDKNILYWIERIKSFSQLRKFVGILRVAGDQLKEAPRVEIIEETEAAIFKLSYQDQVDRIISAKELALSTIDKIEELRQSRGIISGLKTGIPKLDTTLWGMKPGDLILLGSRTGGGKTALSLNIARAVAISGEEATLFINTEMSTMQLQFRLSSMLSGIPASDIRGGAAKDEDFKELTQAMNQLYKAPLYFYNAPNLNLQKLISITRKFHTQHKIKFAIVDYIGRMDKHTADLTEWQALEQIVKSTKILAQNLQIPILVITQLNDDFKLQAARRMENEADIFLKFYPIEEELEGHYVPRPTHFIYVQKNRDGESNVKVPVFFNKPTQVVVGCERY